MHSLLKTILPATICGGVILKHHLSRPSYYKAYAEPPVSSSSTKSEIPSVEELKKSFSDLNKRDNTIWRDKNIKEILACNFSKGYEDIIQNIQDMTVLNELSYIAGMYPNPPLLEHRKINVRNKMLEFYEKSKSDTEKQLYIHILNYYQVMH
jgi:hypothetical protein